MKSPKKKCICRNCDDCNFYQTWDMTNNEGIRQQITKCGFQVLFEEVSRIRGSIDGCQQGVNEARNRAMESKNIVESLGQAMAKAFQVLEKKVDSANLIDR